MNELAMLHVPESKYCFALNEKTVALRLRIDRKDKPFSISVIYGGKYSFHLSQREAQMKLSCKDRLFSYYTLKLSLDDARFVYIFKIVECGSILYYSEDGLTDNYDFSFSFYNSFQLPYINKADIHAIVPWMREAVFYQIFIDRFFKGAQFKDLSYINMAWSGAPTSKSFAGGDLKGIEEKLPYLSSLGVNTIYLTPIFSSISNHKYDISDYYTIDRHFGGNDEFRILMESAHAMGMRIVLDAVFNHCSENLRQFQDVLKNGKNSRYHSWFIIDGDRPDPEKENYECFAACTYMPKFNTSNREVQDYLIGIATFWIKEYGIDGWRLDVSDEVSHDFWRRFRREVKVVKPDCVIIGENWHDANPSLQGDQFDGIMNYAFTKACLDFYAREAITAKQFSEKLNGILMRNSDQANIMMLNILDSHDTHRFLSVADGREDKLIAALATEFMYVGAPGIYYGTEIGMLGGYDPDSRRGFDWSKKESEVTAAVRALAALRKRKELAHGEIEIEEKQGFLIIKRCYDSECLQLSLNCTGKNAPFFPSGRLAAGSGIDEERISNWGFAIECLQK
ncbi:MAG: glycoside hydrolase family 13 protein [Clostridiales bacterium]|nr:glycoside hydrolase family 13 protein [Clostridiales bacterium]